MDDSFDESRLCRAIFRVKLWGDWRGSCYEERVLRDDTSVWNAKEV